MNMNNAPDAPLKFKNGAIMKNRFMLAPMTNTQSHEDGCLSEEEFHWLTMRAKGGFGLVMTCASHIQELGKGFPGQLGIFSDKHIPGHKKLAAEIKSYGSLAVVQLHHAGMRSPVELIKQAPLCPSENIESGARALSLAEVHQLKDDFINAAVRAQKSGYDGVEVHGAHGYILTQFLSSEVNHRTDDYGGSLQNRSRIIFEIIDGIRNTCGPQFLLGIRLSPEKVGMDLHEVKQVCKQLIKDGKIDFLDISLWDSFKMPEDEMHQDKTLMEHFTELELNDIRMTVAGKIRNGSDVLKVLESGVDFISIGRSGILHHDFPMRVISDPAFQSIKPPVSIEYLHQEGLSDKFIEYMRRWPRFVKEPSI
ncbi:MAG: NADH:flavin oxidoreductase [Saprospiraceae bacterium]|nr:NADH:flavin oxidoreductase [Saprospiraceae bacterium]